jgi:predicted nucleic acid-binding protein
LKALKKSIEFINTSCEVIKIDEIMDLSFNIAVKEKINIYDALFVAEARSQKIPLYTMDKKLKIDDNVEVLI